MAQLAVERIYFFGLLRWRLKHRSADMFTTGFDGSAAGHQATETGVHEPDLVGRPSNSFLLEPELALVSHMFLKRR